MGFDVVCGARILVMFRLQYNFVGATLLRVVERPTEMTPDEEGLMVGDTVKWQVILSV